MHTRARRIRHALLGALALGPLAERASAQAVVAAWGNVDGVRVAGEVVPFETSLCLADSTGAVRARTAKERQRPTFARRGTTRTITTRLGAFAFTELVEDVRPGVARLDVTVTADSVTALRPHLCIDTPTGHYGAVRAGPTRRIDLTSASPSVRRRVTFELGSEASVRTVADRRDGRALDRVLVPIAAAPTERGATARATYTITASGTPNRQPILLELDARTPGRVWDGLGGNFRIQNARLDPPVIAYNLANMRVAWARVEMPWRAWHPDSVPDPAARDTAQLDPRVKAAMEIARTTARRGMPVIVSAWFPPQWAVVGRLPTGGGPVNGVWGNALDSTKTDRIYASITSYLEYLKRHYGVEAWAFSFNESDLGIDVRQTAPEHLQLIKGLGAYLNARGLKTTMLLGDVSDATPTWFIQPALADSSSWPYIGAVSYHSWRGWRDSLLTFWSDAAKRIGVPLLVGEGSTDAGAWRYPQIFQEADFALPEIELYVRMLALSEPKSILQWQLTSDYPLLAGGGLFGDSTALRPTQRFWNLKQLASVPAGLSHLRITCGGTVSCAALGSAERGTYAVHVVNMGATRPAVVMGLPRSVRSLRMWTTNERRGMAEGARVAVRGGVARFSLPSASYVTLLSASALVR
ncbi:MAG TPA: hypothetical protein VFS59_06165 [Gemmatimonadaceae bacterium]|nr:hypothetical protein [Gemmatimonadaceae bacterium]